MTLLFLGLFLRVRLLRHGRADAGYRRRPAPEEKGAAPTELEEEVAKALFDIEASAGGTGSCFEMIWRRPAP
jgi:hypothetical protein